MSMLVVVTYDISTMDHKGRRRLRHVAKTCEDYGQRVQKSVFECRVSRAKFFELRTKLLTILEPEEDSLRFYRIVEPHAEYVDTYGLDNSVDFDDPLII